MNHLVIFYSEKGVHSVVYNFKNVPPTIDDIKTMQEAMQRTVGLRNEPVIVNWLPLGD